ncbi:acyltransferase [Zooshikella marina]|uniref:acyltransferase family protein n=1 Tax=Zooshikella ganghwensis TaxID=202772 RepID=UPI00041A88FD|nr:acyltransferase [Zooshikella ganghwensis]MBU2707723.1 acyltransferase [Zooshikella ganghwensis]
MNNTFKSNNFDVIRLLAALQVAISHTITHLKINYADSVFLTLLEYFPGVPIFFFISGFLISKSYENNSHIGDYTRNRVLRLYPALIVCTVIALVSVFVTGYFDNRSFNVDKFIIWIVGQISILQFYNPAFMRDFGTGVLNGSLWTITVEIQFYLVLPVLYWLFGLAKKTNQNWKLAVLIVFFLFFHIAKYQLEAMYANNVIFKILVVSFIPWIWMFLVGVFFQKNFEYFYSMLSGKFFYLLPLYCLVSYVTVDVFGWDKGNGINPIAFLLLATTIFSFAYSFTQTSNYLLKGNDFSYGIYIYHIPVINVLMYFGYLHTSSYLYLVLTVVLLLGVLSWFLVEKPCMKLKKRQFNTLKDKDNRAKANKLFSTKNVLSN